ncbi:DUF4907 domain-containing protein [Flavobacterium johnsoniae]|jgi:uncharacterized lipoprotein YehR (DUF1307 family)|uniref:DUF4907 domain-containing protein n=1 Tax=Flavobacterium johnsoniae TaxID=986 RepID=A0A1M5G2W9_FLAJO|nr:DUF4907 domain-containing protein [Flavobacterium johnsoniae]SHF98160.1 protein of unknown function [Flavobacterium johnsoniae]
MTINTITQFFWRKIQKNLLLLFLVLSIVSCTKKEVLKTETFKTDTGWGYSISYKEKIIIKQSIIPVINENKSFSTQEDALKTAGLVVSKLKQNLSPSVTKNELILLKIKL